MDFKKYWTATLLSICFSSILRYGDVQAQPREYHVALLMHPDLVSTVEAGTSHYIGLLNQYLGPLLDANFVSSLSSRIIDPKSFDQLMFFEEGQSAFEKNLRKTFCDSILNSQSADICYYLGSISSDEEGEFDLKVGQLTSNSEKTYAVGRSGAFSKVGAQIKTSHSTPREHDIIFVHEVGHIFTAFHNEKKYKGRFTFMYPTIEQSTAFAFDPLNKAWLQKVGPYFDFEKKFDGIPLHLKRLYYSYEKMGHMEPTENGSSLAGYYIKKLNSNLLARSKDNIRDLEFSPLSHDLRNICKSLEFVGHSPMIELHRKTLNNYINIIQSYMIRVRDHLAYSKKPKEGYAEEIKEARYYVDHLFSPFLIRQNIELIGLLSEIFQQPLREDYLRLENYYTYQAKSQIQSIEERIPMLQNDPLTPEVYIECLQLKKGYYQFGLGQITFREFYDWLDAFQSFIMDN